MCWVYHVLAIVTLILITLSVLLTLLLVSNHYSEEFVQVEGITTTVSPVQQFWYKSVEITQIVRQYDYNHLLNVVKIKCSELIHHTLEYWFESRSLEGTSVVRNLGQKSYLYMLQESTIEYKICFKSLVNHTEAIVQLFVFNSELDFANYQAKLENGENAIKSVKFTAGNEVSCFGFDFVASASSFYFFVGQTDQHISYQFNMSGSIIYYNISDYDSVCTMTSAQQCSLSIDNSLGSESVCVLVYTHPIPPYLFDPQTTHIIVSVRKRLEVVLFTIIPAAALFVVLAFALTIFCKGYYADCVKKGYRNKNNGYECLN